MKSIQRLERHMFSMISYIYIYIYIYIYVLLSSYFRVNIGVRVRFCHTVQHGLFSSRTLTSPQNYFTSFNESRLKMMKNAFYFILKAPFVLKKFKFLS